MSFVGRIFGFGFKPDAQPLKLNMRVDVPRKLILGKTAHAGDFVFHGLSDQGGKQGEGDNGLLHRVIALAGHECSSCTRVWADGDIVRTSPLSHGVRTEIPAFRDGSKARLWITWYDGRSDQTADPFLTDAFILPLRWTSADRLRGISYAVVTMRHDKDVLTTPPEFIFELEGASLYDRRKDSTAGGSGTHRYGVPSTWQYTTNTAVAADHYQLGIVGGENNDALIFGMGLNEWQVPFDEFAANADICDENVFGISRYAVNGILSAEEDHRANISKLSSAMAAKPYDTGGQIIIRPTQARNVVMTITDDDLVDVSKAGLDPTPSGTDLINFVRGKYKDATAKYNDADYPPAKDETLIARDGRPFEHTLDLPLETNPERAQRIAAIELESQKQRIRINEHYMPIANQLNVGDWFLRVSNLRGPVTKVYEVEDKRVGLDLTVEITARETDPSVTAWGENQAIPVQPVASFSALTGVRPDAPIAIVTAAEKTVGGVTLPIISISIEDSEGIDNIDCFEVQYGDSNGQAGEDLDFGAQTVAIAKFENTQTRAFELAALFPATDYALRFRSVRNDIVGDWGALQSTTTLANFTSAGSSDSSQITASLNAAIDELNTAKADIQLLRNAVFS